MIERTEAGMMITGDFDIERYRILAMIKALEIEIKTGMKYSKFSVLKSANQRYSLGCRTKAQAVAKLRAILDEMNEMAAQMYQQEDDE